jgi:hypothetical protein
VASRIERVHERVVQIPVLILFAAVVRVLLALAFLPSGWVKLAGDRFTTLPVTTPVGFFFEGFFQASGYYRFVGAMQLLAAVLLLFPATAPLGAAVYLPIIINIFAITIAVGFGGTSVVAGLLLTGNLFLLCWDYDRWRALLPRFGPAPRRHIGLLGSLALFAAAGSGFWGVTSLHLARLRGTSMFAPALLVASGAAMALTVAWVTLRRSRKRRS